ncbi:MAG: entA [Phenylobacterium sp.]|nr:entA [Phenylobacterium sp.]
MTSADLFDLTGKAAIVFGGGQGMGESTSLFLARAGCDVAVLDIVPERAERVAAAVTDLGRTGVAIPTDVFETARLAGIVAEAEQKLGRLDVMVSIVGQAGWYDFLEMSEADWDLDHRRNLRQFAMSAQAAARAMVRGGRGGAITAIASVDGTHAAPRHASYGAAKAGLISLVKTMAVELAPHGIRVNAVSPGTIKTPRTLQSGKVEDFDARIAGSNIPFKRSGTTDDIGKAALFLSSDLAAYVTGHNLAVDGGWLAANLLGPAR